MKKLLLSLAVALPMLVFSQSTGNTTLNVRLHPVMSIQVNQPTVDVDIITEADYLDGKNKAVANHLSTFSTQDYQVSIKATSNILTGDTETMELDNITITADGVNNVAYTPAVLSETPTKLIESSKGMGRKDHNVTYNVSDGLWDMSYETYTVGLVYEITAL